MATQRRWFKTKVGAAISVTTIVALFTFLTIQYGFEIKDLTGDFACEGSYENPCISEFTVRNTQPYNVDVYSSDEVKLDFSPNIKDYALFVPDGRCSATGACRCELKDGSRIGYKGWRCVDFTNATKPRDDKAYTFRFPAYTTTTFKLVGIKNKPSDSIKWTFGVSRDELDPLWQGLYGTKITVNYG